MEDRKGNTDTDRTAVARRAARLLRTEEEFRGLLKYKAPDGTRPMITALLEDRVGDLFDLIARNHPGGVNVVVGTPAGGRFWVLTFTSSDEDDKEPAIDCPVHVDSEVGMLVAFLSLCGRKPVRCTPVKGAYEVEGELTPA